MTPRWRVRLVLVAVIAALASPCGAASLRERYFVEAAQAIGVRDWVIILRHILPNTISPILVEATIDLGTVILAMGGLGFLGLGTQPPAPDWGLMVSEGREFILNQWWISSFSGLAMPQQQAYTHLRYRQRPPGGRRESRPAMP